MVWLSKREVAAYLMLLETFGENTEVNIGDASDVLSLMMSRRIARKVIRKLIKKSFLLRKDSVTFIIRPIDEAFRDYLIHYIASRIRRNLRHLNVESEVSVSNSKIIVKLRGDVRLRIPKIPKFIFISYSS